MFLTVEIGLLIIGAIIVFFLIFRFLGSCLVRIILSAAVLIAAGLVIYYLLTG